MVPVKILNTLNQILVSFMQRAIRILTFVHKKDILLVGALLDWNVQYTSTQLFV